MTTTTADEKMAVINKKKMGQLTWGDPESYVRGGGSPTHF